MLDREGFAIGFRAGYTREELRAARDKIRAVMGRVPDQYKTREAAQANCERFKQITGLECLVTPCFY